MVKCLWSYDNIYFEIGFPSASLKAIVDLISKIKEQTEKNVKRTQRWLSRDL